MPGWNIFRSCCTRACRHVPCVHRDTPGGVGTPASADMTAATTPAPDGDIGVTGLATMGANLARNLARHGCRVVVHNRTRARTDALVAAHGDEGDLVPTGSVAEFVAALARPRKVVVMVQAGASTDAVVEEVAALLEAGDVLVD